MAHIKLATPVAHVWYTRRVPSFLGTLLDITRRNLDRVLYFAQYVVTYVDEDARQKAIKRLEEENERRSADLEGKTKAQEDSAGGKLLKQLIKLQQQLDVTNQKYDDQLQEETESLMKAAQRVQREIEAKTNKAIRAPIVFEPTGAVIAPEGETIGRVHLTALNRIVKEQLNTLESKMNEDRDVATDKVRGEIEILQGKVDDDARELSERLSEEMQTLTARYARRPRRP